MSSEFRLEHERRFDVFGSSVRLLIGEPTPSAVLSPAAMAIQLEGLMRMMHRRLTRFDPESELSALNRSGKETVTVSGLLATAIQAGLWAAERSGGLVDPTLVGEIERVGYATSRAHAKSASLSDALKVAPLRRPARPRSSGTWRLVQVDPQDRRVRRPPGVRFDTGGSAKGLAADIASEQLASYETFVVDAGGDLRIGGARPRPRLVRIENPFTGASAHEFSLAEGAVATSGIGTRLWRNGDVFAHHLLDPATGAPAWTGLVQASAVAPSALEAETLAKMAVLSGPERARDVLSSGQGVLIHDDAKVEVLAGSDREPDRDAMAA